MLDENVPQQLAAVLLGHEISTVEQEGWRGIENGALLDRIQARFDVLITSDGNLVYQNRLVGRKLSVIVLPTNRLTILLANVIAVSQTLSDLAESGATAIVEIGWKGHRRRRLLDRNDAPFVAMDAVLPFKG